MRNPISENIAIKNRKPHVIKPSVEKDKSILFIKIIDKPFNPVTINFKISFVFGTI